LEPIFNLRFMLFPSDSLCTPTDNNPYIQLDGVGNVFKLDSPWTSVAFPLQ
ncbi:hypothetical protein K501DRAFT_173710, partial [Backusella circina FSU 941]